MHFPFSITYDIFPHVSLLPPEVKCLAFVAGFSFSKLHVFAASKTFPSPFPASSIDCVQFNWSVRLLVFWLVARPFCKGRDGQQSREQDGGVRAASRFKCVFPEPSSVQVIWSIREIFKCNRKVTYKWFWVSKSELVQRHRKYLCHPLPSSSGGEKLESIQDGSARASLFGFNWSAEQLGGYPGQSASIPCRKSSGKLGKRSKISGKIVLVESAFWQIGPRTRLSWRKMSFFFQKTERVFSLWKKLAFQVQHLSKMQHYDFARRYLVLAPWANGLDGRGEGGPFSRKIQLGDLVAQIAQKTVLHQGFMNLDHLENQCEIHSHQKTPNSHESWLRIWKAERRLPAVSCSWQAMISLVHQNQKHLFKVMTYAFSVCNRLYISGAEKMMSFETNCTHYTELGGTKSLSLETWWKEMSWPVRQEMLLSRSSKFVEKSNDWGGDDDTMGIQSNCRAWSCVSFVRRPNTTTDPSISWLTC